MGPISAETAIDAPREQVFATLTDLGVRPSFCDHFMRDYRIARLPARGKGAAARFRVEPPLFGTWMETEIDEVEAPHLVSEHGRCGRLNRVSTFTAWELLEGPGAVTTVRLTFWTEPQEAIDKIRERFGAARWYRRRWQTALRRLGKVLEGEVSPHAVRAAGADRIETLPTGV